MNTIEVELYLTLMFSFVGANWTEFMEHALNEHGVEITDEEQVEDAEEELKTAYKIEN